MDKKKVLILKIIMSILAAISIALIILYLIELYVLENVSYFTQHFTTFICLFCVGIIALFLPSINKRKYGGDNKGDSMMLVVGILLIICSFISILVSYMG